MVIFQNRHQGAGSRVCSQTARGCSLKPEGCHVPESRPGTNPSHLDPGCTRNQGQTGQGGDPPRVRTDLAKAGSGGRKHSQGWGADTEEAPPSGRHRVTSDKAALRAQVSLEGSPADSSATRITSLHTPQGHQYLCSLELPLLGGVFSCLFVFSSFLQLKTPGLSGQSK